MPYKATLSGTYRYKTRIVLFGRAIPFLSTGWKEKPFKYEQRVESPNIHMAYRPMGKSVPVEIALDVDPSEAVLSLRISGIGDMVTKYIQLPHGGGQSFKFEPWKGIQVYGSASFEAIA